MITTTIPVLPAIANDSPNYYENISIRNNDLVSVVFPAINSWSTEANALASTVNTAATNAISASAAAVSAANFQGTWVNQTTIIGQSWEYSGVIYGVLIAGNTSPIATPSNWFALTIAQSIKNTPSGGIAATTVQAALNELDTEKAPKANPTFTGVVSLESSIIFEGATADAFQTTLTATDPTADNIILVPNKSGTMALVLDIPIGKIDYFPMNTAPVGYLKANGASISRTTYASLFATICPTYGAVTSISNGVGAVVTTPTAHGRVLNDPITFTTTGTLPTGLVAGTTYYVAGSITSTTFQLSATIGGGVITTSSAGSGIHTLIYCPFGTTAADITNFLLPDLRGEFIRGWDDSRGIDTGRVFGSLQTDTLKSHNHGTGVTLQAAGVNWGATTPAWGGDDVRRSITEPLTSSTGGTETRPRNIALLACIKY